MTKDQKKTLTPLTLLLTILTMNLLSKRIMKRQPTKECEERLSWRKDLTLSLSLNRLENNSNNTFLEGDLV